MTILAKAVDGKEFLYNGRSAHFVSERNADKICKMLNELKYLLNDGEVWWKYEVDQYDTAYAIAQDQRFTLYNGRLKRKFSYNWMKSRA